jgi:TPR repeat protein
VSTKALVLMTTRNASKHVLDASFYERATHADSEDFVSMFHYAWCWVDGLGTTPACDFGRARASFRECLKRGTGHSRELVNMFFFRSTDPRFPPFTSNEVETPIRRDQMQREMAIAADRGETFRTRMFAAFHVANRFWLGVGTDVNESSAVAWMQAAAEMGLAMAMLRLGQMHLYGCLGVKKSVLVGACWMFKCSKIERAPPCALYHMGRIYVLGVETPPGSKNIPPNRDMAYSFFKQVARIHVDAALSLAVLDRHRSPDTAREWISVARNNPAFTTARIFEVAGTIAKKQVKRDHPPIPRPSVPPPPVPPRKLSIIIPDDASSGERKMGHVEDDATKVHPGPSSSHCRDETRKKAQESLPEAHTGIRNSKTLRRRVFLTSYR